MYHSTRRLVGASLITAVTLAGTVACSSSKAPSSTATGNHSGATGVQTPAAAFPVTLSNGGTTVTLTQAPTRIVSLSATATEMLFAVGAGSQVKAVDETSDYPSTAPRTKLDAYQLNIEAVAGYQPDLVVEAGLTAAQVTQLQVLHIPVLNEPPATDLAQSYQQIDQLGQATGHLTAATALVATMRQQIAAILTATPKPPVNSTYYYELDQTYYSVTTSTFIGQLLQMLGLHSIADSAAGAAASGGYPQLNAEFILRANPTYIFLADTKCCAQSAATIAKRPGWSTLAAVRAGRVVGLDDDIASRWGPRVVNLLQTISAAMQAHPATT